MKIIYKNVYKTLCFSVLIFIYIFIYSCHSPFKNNNLSSYIENLKWTRAIGGVGGTTYIFDSCSINEFVYITGETNVPIFGTPLFGSLDAFICKYDKNGMLIWAKTFGGNFTDTSAKSITCDGNYIYICGETNGNLGGQSISGTKDMFVSKFDLSGNHIWTRLLGVGGSTTSGMGIICYNNYLYIIGRTNGNLDGQTKTGAYDIFITKYDLNGNRLWTRLKGGNAGSYSWARGITINNNNIYVSGSSDGNFGGLTKTGNTDMFIVNYDLNGNTNWVRLLGVSASDVDNNGIIFYDNNLYLTGNTNGSLPGNIIKGALDFFIARYDVAGNLLWVKQFGESGTETISKDIEIYDGKIYIVGTCTGNFLGVPRFGNVDGFVFKTDINGNKIWVKLFGTKNTTLYVTALSFLIKSNDDINLIISGYTNNYFDGVFINSTYYSYLTNKIESD